MANDLPKHSCLDHKRNILLSGEILFAENTTIDFPPFCLFVGCCREAGQKNCVVYHCLGSVPCSKQLRKSERVITPPTHIFLKAFLETICPSVIKVRNLHEVLWHGSVTELSRKVVFSTKSTGGRSCWKEQVDEWHVWVRKRGVREVGTEEQW